MRTSNDNTAHGGSARSSSRRNRERQEMEGKSERGKAKSSQDVIRVLHNGGSDAVDQASSLELARGPRRTHCRPVHSVKLVYTALLITIMNHQRHRLALNTLFIQARQQRSNEGRLSALLNQSMGATLARITLPGLDWISWGLQQFGFKVGK